MSEEFSDPAVDDPGYLLRDPRMALDPEENIEELEERDAAERETGDYARDKNVDRDDYDDLQEYENDKDYHPRDAASSP